MRIFGHFHWAPVGVLAGALCASACDHEVESPPVEARLAPSGDLHKTPPPRRGRVIGGEAVARRVVWPTAVAQPSASVARLDHLTLGKSPVPVLVPADFDDGQTLATGETWYAFAGTFDGVEIALQGSASSKIVPGIRAVQPTHTIRGAEGFVTRNEGIWSVTWTENGAAYSLEIGCAEPFDAPCDDEAFALSWVDGLVFAGQGEEAP